MKVTKYPVVFITMSPSAEDRKKIMSEYMAETGTDNSYEYNDVYERIYRKYVYKETLNNVTLHEAQVYAEPLRIKNPDLNVNVTVEGGSSFICNTTLNDQMQMFFEYETYTDEGKRLQEIARKKAASENRRASYE